MRLVAANVGRRFSLSTGSPAEHLNTTGGTLRFLRTALEWKFWRSGVWGFRVVGV